MALALLAVAASACSNGGGGAAATSTTVPRRHTPAESLREVVAYVEAHPRMHVTGTSDYDHSEPVHQEVDADLVLPDRSSVRTDDGNDGYETRTVDGHYYWRSDQDELWVSDRFDPGSREVAVPGAVAVLQGLVGALSAPIALGPALVRLDDLERLRPGRLRGTTTFRALLPAATAQAAEELVAPLDGSDILDAIVAVTVDHGASGRPRRLELELVGTLRGTPFRDDLVLRFDGWAEDVEVAAPSEAEIDETPYVDEAVLAGIDPPLPTPTDLPLGWILSESYVMQEDAAKRTCTQVYLDYSPYHRVRGVEEKVPDAAGKPLQVELVYIADCPYDDFRIDWTGATRLGPYESVPIDFPEDTWYSEDVTGPAVAVRVGYWTMLLRTNAGADVRRRVVSSLAPFPDPTA